MDATYQVEEVALQATWQIDGNVFCFNILYRFEIDLFDSRA